MPNSIAAIAASIPAAPAAYWPQFSLQTPLPNWVVVASSASPWYLDALKAGLGSLFGALVAFIFAIWHRRMQETKANLRAGNLALLKLRVIQRRTGDLRLTLRTRIVTSRAAHKDAPKWALLRPLLLSMDDIEAFDLDSLSFLLDTDLGRKAVERVAYVEAFFSTLKVTLERHQEAALEVQKATDALPEESDSWEAVEGHLGIELVSRRSGLFDSLLYQVERSQTLLKPAFIQVETAMKDRFGTKVWGLDIDFPPNSAHAEANLPPLPEDLQEMLAERRKSAASRETFRA